MRWTISTDQSASRQRLSRWKLIRGSGLSPPVFWAEERGFSYKTSDRFGSALFRIADISCIYTDPPNYTHTWRVEIAYPCVAGMLEDLESIKLQSPIIVVTYVVSSNLQMILYMGREGIYSEPKFGIW
jgi:hypothetical protein